MSRDARNAALPAGLMVVLWASVAAWLHFGLGVSGYEVAVAHDDRKALSEMGDRIRDRVRSSEQTFDVVSPADVPPTAQVTPVPPPVPTDTPKKPEIKPKPAPTETAKKPDPPKKDEKKVVVAVKPDPTPPVVLPPQPKQDKRIAVRQHVKPNQQDNPEAHFIGDEANHTTEESVARLTSHDRDDENPTPAGNHQNSDKSEGDSENNKVAEQEDHRGDKNRAPGEKGTEFEVQHDPMPEHPMGPVAIQGPPSATNPQSGGDGKPPVSATNAPPVVDPSGASAPAAPDVTSAQNGGWTFSLANPNAGAGDEQQGGAGANRVLQSGPPQPRAFGLGGNPGPGKVNINLTQSGVIAAVGQDELRKEREADGERRKSEHRGSWQASNFERWRSAIENYVSSVKPGNQTALNTAAVPFATYINGIHNRIHPIFADTFLASLDNLPPSHVLSDQKLITRLEIVLTRDGHIVKMGVNKTSGVTAFDIAALDSVQRASPFGPAPSAIVSPDGQVYLHWEFHRDEVFACSTMNARPYILNVPPTGAPPDPVPNPANPTPNNGREKGPPGGGMGDTREGMILLPVADRHS